MANGKLKPEDQRPKPGRDSDPQRGDAPSGLRHQEGEPGRSSEVKQPEAGDGLQGEGDYEAARRYRKDVGEFLETADIEKAARAAAPGSKREAEEMAAAEAAGRDRRKGS
jgi:hypothetical protein